MMYVIDLSRTGRRLVTLFTLMLLSACSDQLPDDNVGKAPSGDFELRFGASEMTLIEGSSEGLAIPLSIVRQNGHAANIQLSVDGVTDNDLVNVSTRLSRSELGGEQNQSELTLQLAIDDRPIREQRREFIVSASDGVDRHTVRLSVDVMPVDAPDVYLLIGQSNMVGFSGDGTRQAWPGGADATHPRIKQLNVTANDRQSTFLSQVDFRSRNSNIVSPVITVAEDPLHVPLDPENSGKDEEYIGLGLSFAKRALQDTSRDIVLVPAAWSGSSFCLNDNGPNGQWNASTTDDPDLGNTWLFDRAIARANLALEQTGGILRGILWHQGESDANERCADSYEQNLDTLIAGLRSGIEPDLRGDALRRADSNIPFVAGTMSRGIDERGDLSDFPPSKELIDTVHRTLPGRVAHTGLSNHDDLTPANGYPCGNTTCVHFGAEALREMGSRYYDALLRAADGS